ncbi:MAG: tetratricopeptide repeat protein [Flavobacteriaceae bacterium]|nr:tetratricopeptide repeat protein [Bacteroidia bacterium]NNF74591.1 tetratricopeptide repeat protein [Flavobacteriaceae bacterium]NNK72548.1 tetratricopeptide repeat protein [Flavobacteriaceae bacterium]
MTLNVSAQEVLSAKEWQEDLKFLQQTVHKDYSFLFKKTTKADFDTAVEKLYKEIPKLEQHEIIIGMAKLVSSFKYGHTVLGFRYSPYPFHQLPLNLYWFNDGLFVQGAHKDQADVLGAKVTGIGKMTTEEALKAIYPVIPSENDQFFKAYGPLYITVAEVLHAQGVIDKLSTEVELSFEKDGKSFKKVISTLPKGERVPTQYSLVQTDDNWLEARNQDVTPNYLKNLDKIYYFEYLPESKTVYVRQSQIQDDPSEDIPTFYAKVFDFIENNDVEKMVIDVRLNGGGNNYKNKPVVTGIIETEKINEVGKLFVIIGRRTFSACQNLINELDNYTNAVFIGEPSSENINFYGDNRRVDLPNSKIPAYLSFAWWQDKPQWEGAEWTAPHLAVDMSYEEYQTNKDPVLEVALSFDDSDFVLDPMEYMTNLFMAGEIERLTTEVPEMVRDPKYKFFDFESNLNAAGYNLLSSSQMEEAIFVFDFNTKLFPDSPNCWDSLAEGYWKAGNLEKAKEYYNKAIEMDPNGPTGQNAKDMLAQINSQGND